MPTFESVRVSAVCVPFTIKFYFDIYVKEIRWCGHKLRPYPQNLNLYEQLPSQKILADILVWHVINNHLLLYTKPIHWNQV